jgi:DNA-binding IclR family transcriptional regulator
MVFINIRYKIVFEAQHTQHKFIPTFLDNKLQPFTGKTIRDPETLKEELKRAMREGGPFAERKWIPALTRLGLPYSTMRITRLLRLLSPVLPVESNEIYNHK